MSEKKTSLASNPDETVQGTDSSGGLVDEKNARRLEKAAPSKKPPGEEIIEISDGFAPNGNSAPPQAGDEAAGKGSEPLSAIAAYRLDRERMFAARLKEMREREAYKEAVKEASKAANIGPVAITSEQVPATLTGSAASEPLAVQPRAVSYVAQAESRLKRTLLSAAFFVGLPVLISILYFGILASNQYASVAQFSINTNSPPTTTSADVSTGLASYFAGGSSSSMMAILGEMFVLQDYIASPQIISDIKPHLDLRAIYCNPHADYFSRLPSQQVSDADLLKYWKTMVTIQFDNTTGLATLTVKAFTPQDAKAIADCILLLSENLVNKMSIRAQNDSLAFARKEVEDSYDRVLKAHKAMTDFAVQQPSGADGLSVRDKLSLELNFDEQAYATALTSLEAARIVAMNKGLYLEAFVQPQLADAALYPTRLADILLTLLASSLLWVLGNLVYTATKDHL